MPTGIYIRTEEHRMALKGRKNGGGWNKGKKCPQNAMYGEKNPMKKLQGELSPSWKGDKVGYGALHDWIKKILGKATYCSIDNTHGSVRYCWGNISGKYKRDLSDWRQLCYSCNMTDGVRKHERFHSQIII